MKKRKLAMEKKEKNYTKWERGKNISDGEKEWEKGKRISDGNEEKERKERGG